MTTLDPTMGGLVADHTRAWHRPATPRRSQRVRDRSDGRVSAVVIGDSTLPADVVVLGLGVKPSVRAGRDAGIEIGPTGGIATDARMATSVSGVWAPATASSATTASAASRYDRARHPRQQAGPGVGEIATGGDARFAGVIGTAMTRICDTEVARTGLNVAEARHAGFDISTSTVEPTTRAATTQVQTTITVKVVVERGSHRCWVRRSREGRGGKRIDVFATAIWTNERSTRSHSSTWATRRVSSAVGIPCSCGPPVGPRR